MRLQLGLAFERRQPRLRPVAPLQREVKQIVGKLRILGEERTVEIGAKRVAKTRAFGAVPAVVASTDNHATERRAARAEKGSAAVIFESDDLERSSVNVHLNHRVANVPTTSGDSP